MKDPNQILEDVQAFLEAYAAQDSAPDDSQQEAFPLVENVAPVPKIQMTAYEMSVSCGFVTHALKLEAPGTKGSVLRVTFTEKAE
jgi:hypothetical protein